MDRNQLLYIQLIKILEEEIQSGNLVPGEIIPSENQLMKKYNVSRTTVRKALDILVEKKLLRRVRGSGTYVEDKTITHNIFTLKSFKERMIEENKKPSTKVLNFKVEPAKDKLASILNINSDDLIYLITRVMCANDEPIIYETSYLPVNLFPELNIKAMENSKYEYVEKQQGFIIKESIEEITADLVSEELSQIFKIEAKQPIMKSKIVTFLSDGTPFEYSEIFFKPSAYKFKIKHTR